MKEIKRTRPKPVSDVSRLSRKREDVLDVPMETQRKNIDFIMFVTVLILLFFGTIMVFSSSAPHAYNYMKGDTYSLIKKQIIFASIGLIAMLIMMNYDYRKLAKISPVIFIISMLTLLLVIIPGVGSVFNGARRWIVIAGQSFQPTELAKISLILFVSHSLTRRRSLIKKFKEGLLPYLILTGFVAGLIMLEPHFSATLVIGFVITVLLFCAGAKLKHFFFLSAPVLLAGTLLVFSQEYRLKRLVAFMDPWSDPRGGGWQIVQSLYAIGSGGIFGRGLGKSLQKFLYIPEPYNDFIFSVLAEEFGFFGVVTVMILFCMFVWRGIKIAMNAPDLFGSLVAVGITSLVGIQVIINIAVVTSSMPVTGMPLPFFSYGGTSLVFLLLAVGILLNISRYGKYERM